MPVKCPKCQKEYGTEVFGTGREITCGCGAKLGLPGDEIFDQLAAILRDYEIAVEEEKLAEIKAAQDRIAFLIMSSDVEAVDIEIEKKKFRDLIEELFPDKVHLYDLIYEPRFQRLWDQFRDGAR